MTVLVVDDRANLRRLLEKVLRGIDDIVSLGGGAEAIAWMQEHRPAVVLCDLRMPKVDGLEVLRQCRLLHPTARFVLMTAYASVENAVEAMRLGAYDYLAKPFEPDDVRMMVRTALRYGPTTEEVLPGLLGASPAMKAMAERVRLVAPTPGTALVLGETGTGKEKVARALHRFSGRQGRFVPVNCAAIPSELIESELFGHRRGAFSGATAERKGLFEEAERGTLFLDEVGELPLSVQAKLTRCLQEKAIRRLGESEERPVDVRVVAATHRDLEAMVREQRFREDLWYRLAVLRVEVPPLRRRGRDAALLATQFLSAGGASLSAEAAEAIVAHRWAGNVRQLRGAMEQAQLLAKNGRVGLAELPAELTAREQRSLFAMPWTEAMDEAKARFARAYLRALLDAHDGAVGPAAAAAGLERESLYRLLRRHGVGKDA